MKFGQNCEICSNLVNIVKFHKNCEIWLDLSNLVWFGMALYGLVEILKLHVGSGRLYVGSGRLCVGSGRLSRRVGLKSVGWVGQTGG